MRCEMTRPLAMLCDDCPRKWLVQPDTLAGDMEFFCFDTEEEARACFNQIEQTGEYDGQRFLPQTAVLFRPQEEASST